MSARGMGIRHRTVALAIGLLVAVTVAVCVPGTAQAAPQPTIQLHYDYLVYDGHSNAPDPAAIQQVVDSYAAHGIDLAIDRKHTAIPVTNPVLALDTDGARCPDAVSFSDLKQQYFKRAGKDWHYVIFGEQVTSTGDCVPGAFSGVAELPGDDFVVSMDAIRVGGPPVTEDPAELIIRRRATAGVFMHELGHNLDLRHGGNEDVNWKPNYLSVMNYAFNLTGIPRFSRMDYSDAALPTLDQIHLDETVGVGADSDDFTRFFVEPCAGCGFFNGFGPARGPLDWNRDGDTTDTDLEVHLLDASTGVQLPRFITGFDDWDAVHAYLASSRPKTTRLAHEDRLPDR